MKKNILAKALGALIALCLGAQIIAADQSTRYLSNNTAYTLDVIVDYDNGNSTEPKTLTPYTRTSGASLKDSNSVLEFPAQWPGSASNEGFPTKITLVYPSASAATAIKSTIDLPKVPAQNKKAAEDFYFYRIVIHGNFLQQMLTQLQSGNISIQGIR